MPPAHWRIVPLAHWRIGSLANWLVGKLANSPTPSCRRVRCARPLRKHEEVRWRSSRFVVLSRALRPGQWPFDRTRQTDAARPLANRPIGSLANWQTGFLANWPIPPLLPAVGSAARNRCGSTQGFVGRSSRFVVLSRALRPGQWPFDRTRQTDAARPLANRPIGSLANWLFGKLAYWLIGRSWHPIIRSQTQSPPTHAGGLAAPGASCQI